MTMHKFFFQITISVIVTLKDAAGIYDRTLRFGSGFSISVHLEFSTIGDKQSWRSRAFSPFTNEYRIKPDERAKTVRTRNHDVRRSPYRLRGTVRLYVCAFRLCSTAAVTPQQSDCCAP